MEPLKEEWKEWTYLRTLTDQIPQQFQHGLSISPLSLTCIDAYPDHLILGTNAGLVYLAHLPSFNIIKLKCENSFAPITCVAAISSVDDMIAVGDSKGSIIIFQIPIISVENNLTASHGSNIFSNQYRPRSPKRFILKLHKCSLTALVWSRNCTKLFSGDTEGNICMVQVDYERGECTGQSMFQVDSRVVQLSYSHQILAVSFKERCLLYNLKDDSKSFVGSKPRHPPGLFGCILGPSSENPKESILYCARPGQKIWVSNTEGVVLYSYIQQKLPEHSQIQLIGVPKCSQGNLKCSFGFLYHYKESILISHSENSFIILNVKDQKVLGYSCAFNKICDIAVVGDYIFVLESNRHIICISQKDPCFTLNSALSPLVNSVHLPLKENRNLDTLNGIKSKIILPNQGILNNIAKIGETVASKISEMTTPTIIPGNKVINNITKEELENHKSGKCKSGVYRPKPYFSGVASSAAIQAIQRHDTEFKSGYDDTLRSSEESSSPSDSSSKDTRMEDVILPIRSRKKVRKKQDLKSTEIEGSKSNFDGHPKSFNNDSRTYEAFKEKIEENESLLAEVLNLSCLRMDHEKIKADRFSQEKQELDQEFILSIKELQSECESSPVVKFICSTDSLESRSPNPSSSLDLGYGPPSGSSAVHYSLDDVCNLSRESGDGITGKLSDTSLLMEEYESIQITTMPPPVQMPLGWRKNHLPAIPIAFMGYKNSICFTESRNLYFSDDFFLSNEKLPSWNRRRLSVEVVAFCSFDKDLVLQIKKGIFINIDRDKFIGSNLQNVCNLLEHNEHIRCSAFDQNILWILYYSGKLMGRNLTDGERGAVRISCMELTFRSLVCRSGVVWGLTDKGRISYRIGVRPNVPLGLEWGILLHPDEVISIHLSQNGLGWMMDSSGHLFVTLYVSQSYPQGLDGKWWQVGLSDYMFEEAVSSSKSPKEGRSVMMTSNEHYLWLLQAGCNHAFTHPIKSFVGHRWESLGDDTFVSMCAGGVFKSYGILYSLDISGNLFAVSSYSDRVVPIDLPGREKLVSISSRPESLWVLTKSGKIFIRSGLSGKSVLGLKWIRLSLHQIDDVKLKHLSLSAEVVWAVDITGAVYMRQGPLTPQDPKKKGLDPAWLQVDSKELKNGAVFEKVYVGNKNHLVWGIDSSHRIYVREAIYPEFPTGTSWVLVPGILAEGLSISEDRVFAVTSDCGSKSKVFEREGITSSNYIGDSWQRIPSNSIHLKHISASVDNCLWGLDQSGKIYKHSLLCLSNVSLDGKLPEETHQESYSSSDLEDWEVI